ncbi:MAG: response regulator [Microcoleus sp.]
MSAETATNTKEVKQILVVDDEPNIRELLRQSLEEEGYEVTEAFNGIDAISQAKSVKPDLIILDIMMPHIDGFDVAAVLKHDPQTMGIPIIIVSLIHDLERGARLGIDSYFTKPINVGRLLREIGLLLNPTISNKTVLVVDRNPSNLKTVSDALVFQGYNVIKAYNAEECLGLAISRKPNLIIIDEVLSQEKELVKTLRLTDGLENVSLIFMGNMAVNTLPKKVDQPNNNT